MISINHVGHAVHEIICRHVLGPKLRDDDEVRHLCGNGHLGCVTPKHLIWGTHTENVADTILHGTIARGEKHGNAKLTTFDVVAIRSDMTRFHKELAATFGVTRRTIGDVKQRRSWAWLV
jgi:hypothetical protein